MPLIVKKTANNPELPQSVIRDASVFRKKKRHALLGLTNELYGVVWASVSWGCVVTMPTAWLRGYFVDTISSNMLKHKPSVRDVEIMFFKPIDF